MSGWTQRYAEEQEDRAKELEDLRGRLAAVTSERDVLSKKLREVAIDYVDGHDQEALLQWLASVGGRRMSLRENIAHCFREYPKMKDQIESLEAQLATVTARADKFERWYNDMNDARAKAQAQLATAQKRIEELEKGVAQVWLTRTLDNIHLWTEPQEWDDEYDEFSGDYENYMYLGEFDVPGLAHQQCRSARIILDPEERSTK